MELLAHLLTLYTWGAVCVLLFFLFGITQFFEKRRSAKNSVTEKRLYSPLFLFSGALFGLSALPYAFSEILIVGNFWADILRIIGSLVFIYSGYSVFSIMLGGKS